MLRCGASIVSSFKNDVPCRLSMSASPKREREGIFPLEFLSVRPLSAFEAERGCHPCANVDEGENAIDIGHKAYAFDKVFDTDAPQSFIYGYVEPHIKRCFNGFNATVLAYGQTGSGKTYTMGTGFNPIEQPEDVGILPRAIGEIFHIIENERELAKENNLPEPEYQLGVQFIEVYQDAIRNLINPHHSKAMKKVMQTKIMRQHKAGEMNSLEAVSVTTPEEVLELLRTGCLNRTTGSTRMNASSSRSHAIFTLNLFMKKDKRLELLKEKMSTSLVSESSATAEGESPEPDSSSQCNGDVSPEGEPASTSSEQDEDGEDGGLVTFVSKFTFVDLAGSERADRTQSSGVTFSEGISINTGLHHLGTVIASLARGADHIPYRNSKLTYILADAFGGNSRTVFIACISASDADLAESLNTLTYANEAKRIKNRVTMNRKDSSQTLILLQREVEKLRKELDDIREGRKVIAGDQIVENDMFYERQVNMERIRELEMKVLAMTATIDRLNREVAEYRVKAALAGSSGSQSADGSEMNSFGVEELLRQQIEENTVLRSKQFELQTAYDKMKDKFMTMSSMKGLEDFNVASPSAPGTFRPASEAAQNMGVAQAVAVAKEELEVMKNELIKVQGQETGEEEENGSSESSDEEDSEQDSGQENEEIQNTRGGAMRLHRQMAALTTLINEVEVQNMRMSKIQDSYEKHIHKLQKEIAQVNKGRKPSDPPRPPPSPAHSSSKPKAGHPLKPSASVPAMPRTLAPPPTPPSARKFNPIRKVSSRTRVPPEPSPTAAAPTPPLPPPPLTQETEKKVRALTEQLNSRTEEKKKVDAMVKDLWKKIEASKKEKDHLRREWQKKVEELQRLKSVEAQKLQKKFTGEIGQLQKIQQKQDRKISKLETETQKTKEMLRRKENELSSTKKQVQELIKKQTEVRRSMKGRKKKVPVTKESIWKEMSESLAEMAIKRGSTQALCNQLGVYLNKRNESFRSLEKYRTQRDETTNEADREELEERVVNAAEEFDFFTSTIQDMNELIAAAEQIEFQHVTGTQEHFLGLIETCKEPRFFLEQLMKKCIAQATALYLQNQKMADLRSVVEEHEKNIEMKQQLLEYLCHLHSDEIDAELDGDGEDLVDIEADLESIASPNLFACDDDQATVILGRSESSERLGSPFDSLSSSQLNLPPTKMRQKTKTVPELLYGIDDSSRPESPHFHLEDPGDIFIHPLSESNRKSLFDEISALRPSLHSDPGVGNGSMESSVSSQASGLPFQFDLEDGSSSSSSPSVTRSLNVFQRLSSVPGTAPIMPTKGSVLPFVASLSSTFNNNLACGASRRARSRFGTSSLCCELVATGHAAAVKCIHATEELLVSGSKDCTVKVWDLRTTTEVLSFAHQRPVKSVKMMRNDPNTVISASGPLVRLWDLRSGTCTRTLTSQGLEWEPGTNVFSPRGMISEEVTALEVVDAPVPTLFVAAGDRVRLWNLNSLMAVASLNHPFNKGVRCMAACVVDEDGSVNVATGCKDHTARVFKLNLDQVKGAVQASTVLEPPFYDEITAMKVMNNNTLYAASRDGCMKKWRLGEKEAMQTISGPQNVRITCMCCDEYHGVVLTGDKKGNVKVWSHTPEASQCLDDFLAHETGGVNDLAYNSSFVFSASDVDVKFWRPSSRIEYLNIMFRSA